MKYIIDKKKNKETVYSMSPDCERCMYEYNGEFPWNCEECAYYTPGCRNYKEISSGKIGMAFLEFISNDLEKIRDELSSLWHSVEHKGTDYALDALHEYLEDKPYYLQLLDIDNSFCHYIEHAGRIPDFESIEVAMEVTFETLIIIRKIISAYADDKYFIEPSVLLQAIDEFKLMFLPSAYTPNYRDEHYRTLVENPVETLKSFAKDCKQNRGNVYEFYDFRQMFGVALDWIVSNNYKISRCENCGKFFVPYGRYDAKYCEYPFKNGKSCRELSFSINVDNNAVLKEYRKIYKTKHAWTKRNKVTQPGVETDFERWHKNAKTIVDKYKLGAVSEMEALKWLEDNK